MRIYFNLVLCVIGLVCCAGIYVLLAIECPETFGNKKTRAWKTSAWIGMALAIVFIVAQMDFTGKPCCCGTIENVYCQPHRALPDDYWVVLKSSDGASIQYSTMLGIGFSSDDEDYFHEGDNVTIWGSTWGSSFYRIEHTE